MKLTDDIKQLSQQIVESYDTRLAAVGDSRRATTAFLQASDANHNTMAMQQRKQLREYMTTLRRTGQEQRQQRRQYTSRLRHDTTKTLRDQQASRQTMATQQRQQLHAYTNTLRHDTAKTLRERDKEHDAMAQAQRQHLAAQQRTLVTDVATMRTTLQQDQRGAHQTWRVLGSSMEQRRRGIPAAPPPQRASSRKSEPTYVIKPVVFQPKNNH